MDGELALDQPLPSKTATDKVSILPQAEIVENPVRQFSKAAREALITRGCTIIQVGDSGLTVEQKKDRLRAISSGLINDQEIERLLKRVLWQSMLELCTAELKKKNLIHGMEYLLEPKLYFRTGKVMIEIVLSLTAS